MGLSVVTTSYGPPALEALRGAVTAAKAGAPLAPVTVLVPSNTVGVVARRHLARPAGLAAVAFLTVGRLAELLAAPALAAQGRRPLTRPVLAASVRRVLAQRPGRFAPIARHPATVAAVLDAHRELREVAAADLDVLAGRGGVRAAEVVRLHRALQAAVEGSWYDEVDLVEEAAVAVRRRGPLVAGLGHVVVHLPQRAGRSATGLCRALADVTDVTLVLGLTGSEAADAEPRRIAAALGVTAPAASPAGPRHLEVVTAPDADDEVRAAVRVLVDAARRGVPFDRTAVLYPAAEPYRRLLAEHLDAAGLPWNGVAGPRPRERLAARTLLAVLDLPGQGFTRSGVLALLAGLPGGAGRAASWERLSREAGVVGGLDDWRAKLSLVAAQADEAAAVPDIDEPWRAERAARQAVSARRLLGEVEHLAAGLPIPGERCRWHDLARRCARLLDHLLGGEARRAGWPAGERGAADRVGAALDRLASLDEVEAATDLDGFRDALDAELDADLDRRGRLGDGVHVGALSGALGLDADLVIVVGAAEGTLPTRVRDTALVPDLARSLVPGALPLAVERPATELRHLLAAFAGVERAVLVAPRGDLRRSAHRHPSRWLRALASHLHGVPLAQATDLERLRAPWLHHVPSFGGGLAGAEFPATAQEQRLGALRRHAAAGQPAAAHPLALAVAGAGIACTLARRSSDFTPYDGNLAGIVLGGPHHDGRLLSASRIETWITCPHAYFVQHLLHVQPVDDPEALVDVDPRDSGRLVHDVLDRFVRDALERRGGTAPPPDQAWDEADRARLDDFFREAADRLEAQGRTGHPVLWQRTQARLRRDLHRILDIDSRRRRERGARPLATELAFGLPGGLPPVEVSVPGAEVRFRGFVDRVDVGDDGTVYVTDYKTGRPDRYRSLSQASPFGADHTHLQLALYGRAARLAATDARRTVAEYWFVSADTGEQCRSIEVDAAVDAGLDALVSTVVGAMADGCFPLNPPAPGFHHRTPCRFCDPDEAGTGTRHRAWLRKQHAPGLAAYVALIGATADD
jgi:hypothetical protein